MRQSTLSLSAHSTSKSAPSDRPRGFSNHGNTCFANALIQSVFCLPRVRDYLLDHGVQPHQLILPEGPAGADNCIYCVLQGMLYAYNGVASREIHRLMTQRYLGRQQDSHKVIILLMCEKRF
jgi:ubiquitin C-terminal hydrolase